MFTSCAIWKTFVSVISSLSLNLLIFEFFFQLAFHVVGSVTNRRHESVSLFFQKLCCLFALLQKPVNLLILASFSSNKSVQLSLNFLLSKFVFSLRKFEVIFLLYVTVQTKVFWRMSKSSWVIFVYTLLLSTNFLTENFGFGVEIDKSAVLWSVLARRGWFGREQIPWCCCGRTEERHSSYIQVSTWCEGFYYSAWQFFTFRLKCC